MQNEYKIIEALNLGRTVDLNKISNSKFYKIVNENDCYVYFLMPLKENKEFLDDFLTEHIIERKYNLAIVINYKKNSISNILFFSNSDGHFSFDSVDDIKIIEISPKDLFALRILAEEEKIHKKDIFKFFIDLSKQEPIMDDKKIFELLKNNGIEIEALDTKPKTFYKIPLYSSICFATRHEDLDCFLMELKNEFRFRRRLNLFLSFHDKEFDGAYFYNNPCGHLSFNPITNKIKKITSHDLFLLKKLEISNKNLSDEIRRFFEEYKLTKI